MKKHTHVLLLAFLSFGLAEVQAQLHSSRTVASGLNLSGATTKLFGENQTFSAMMIYESADSKHTNTSSGKFYFDSGKVRHETSIVEMMGSTTPPGVAAQIKSLGMDSSVIISRPDKKMSYIIFPALKNYIEDSVPAKASVPAPEDFKEKSKVLGKEMVDGFETTKKDVVVTGKHGDKEKFRVWYATDLRHFPIRIETIERDGRSIRRFKNVSFEKPAPNLFEIPADFTKNASLQSFSPAR